MRRLLSEDEIKLELSKPLSGTWLTDLLNGLSPQVDIEINGEPVSLQMKLGENGEAFFVKETESNEVSSALCTKQ